MQVSAQSSSARCLSPEARTLPIAEDSVRPMLPALTEARVAANTKAVTTASTQHWCCRREATTLGLDDYDESHSNLRDPHAHPAGDPTRPGWPRMSVGAPSSLAGRVRYRS